jgi:transposase-like protein
VVSKSTVARICRDTAERYRQWSERRLAEHDLVYLFLDAIYLKLRPEDEPAEACSAPGASPSRARRSSSASRLAAAKL